MDTSAKDNICRTCLYGSRYAYCRRLSGNINGESSWEYIRNEDDCEFYIPGLTVKNLYYGYLKPSYCKLIDGYSGKVICNIDDEKYPDEFKKYENLIVEGITDTVLPDRKDNCFKFYIGVVVKHT